MTEILNEFESNATDSGNNNSRQSQATIHQLNQTDEPGNKQSPPARTSGAKGKVLFKNSPVAKFEDFKAAFV
ncbi:MAG: hypothetical protein GY751_01855, partial [Bacteroidetes bacterium]|nr:hypothetical protein [Bacteroidota bacterium]